ncbi:MAG: DUF4252 domain-containing protein [Alistipes sp.]|nr:DUF4252 domain-containing protein [Alistipes sp.]
MKHIAKNIILSVALCVMTTVTLCAQEPSKVETRINEIVKKYEEVKGVECMTVAKGSGLAMVKMMLNTQFGKDFMKGVTSITIIDYSDSSQEVCLSLRKELDTFLTLLEEFKIDKDEELSDNDYVRSFASVSDNGTISDFITAIEEEDSKMIMYMAGKIKVE